MVSQKVGRRVMNFGAASVSHAWKAGQSSPLRQLRRKPQASQGQCRLARR